MKVYIAEGCTQCGVCIKECPEVFCEDNDGNAIITEEFQGDSEFEGEVSDDMAKCVKAEEKYVRPI
ncbi:MAG: ferredoxin [Candidatus Methanofastidiosa archaeon]|jgi:ferredoxin|nr:ferredoxin [Candidatus Methanofastidiosa archaeon]